MSDGCCASLLTFQTSLFQLQTSSVVAPRIELGTTSLSARPGQPALDYRLSFQKVGHLGVEPPVAERPTDERSLLLPKQACFHLHLYPMLFVFAADVSVGAYLPCQWAGRRSNPRLRFFRPPLDRLSYQPKLGSLLGLPVRCGHEKKARCLGDTEPS